MISVARRHEAGEAGASAVFGKLNPRQRQAACAGSAPLLILAGAGTGKTSTLAHRVAHLVLQKVDPQRILLLTFTRRAAQEMTRRAQRIVAEALGEASPDGTAPVVRLPWSGTFHAIANRLIRRHAARLGLAESFSVLDRGDAADLMDLVRHDLGYSKIEAASKRFPRKDTCLAIYSHKVNTQGALERTLADVFPWCAEWEEQLKGVFKGYVERKIQSQSLDYDDLLLYWHAMVGDAGLAGEVSAMFDHILVDEYQDTNTLQADILKRIRPGGEGLTVVGDDAQSIYSFRAASVGNILGFPADFPGSALVALEDNYRSTQQVLDAANALIGKNLRSSRPSGPKPRYVTVADDSAQGEYVVTRVLEARERGTLLRRQAVLFRSSHHADGVELELVRRNIPYVKYGGLKFLEAAHVKDLLAVLRWADNPKNRVAAWRALQLLPGVGPATAERVFTGFEASGFSWAALDTGSRETDELMSFLAGAPWAGQVQRVREWYEPHLERKYDAAQVRAADRVLVREARSLPHRPRARSAAGERRPRGSAASRRGLPDPLHRALGEGPGMGLGVRAQRERRQFPERVFHRQAGAHRRGAAPALRRAYARAHRPPPDRAHEILRHGPGAHGRQACLRREKPVPDGRGPRVLRRPSLGKSPGGKGCGCRRPARRCRGRPARDVELRAL